MDLDEAFRPQSLAQRVKGIMCGNLIVAYTDSITIDLDFGQLLAEFPIGRDTFFNFEIA